MGLRKVCVATPEYLPNGSGIAMACNELAEGLRKNGIQVDVLSRTADADIQIKNIRSFSGILGLTSFWHEANKYLSENQDDYDIVWMHEPFFYGFNEVKNVERIAITIHTTYYGFNSAFKNSGNQLLRIYYELSSKIENVFFKSMSKLKGIKVVYAITPEVASEINMNGLNKTIRFLPNCIDPEQFKIYQRDYARKKLSETFKIQFTENCKILLSIGRINEVKRTEFIIKIFHAISANFPSLRLLLLGDGPQFNQISSISAHNKNIHLFGNIDRKSLGLFYSAADAFISLSLYEGLPMTLLEASHYGLPLILSDIPAHRWFKGIVGYPCKLISSSFNLKELIDFIKKSSLTREPSYNSLLPKPFHSESLITTFIKNFQSI